MCYSVILSVSEQTWRPLFTDVVTRWLSVIHLQLLKFLLNIFSNEKVLIIVIVRHDNVQLFKTVENRLCGYPIVLWFSFVFGQKQLPKPTRVWGFHTLCRFCINLFMQWTKLMFPLLIKQIDAILIIVSVIQFILRTLVFVQWIKNPESRMT